MDQPLDDFAISDTKPAVARDSLNDADIARRVSTIKEQALDDDYKEVKLADVKPQKVHVFLKSHDTGSSESDNANTLNEEKKVYVIIGNGFAAVSNHATLLKSNSDRSKNLKECDLVFHVGFPDPWSGYVTHNMNQEPELNIPPGYHNRQWTAAQCGRPLPQGTPDTLRWLPSNEFAQFTEDEFKKIVAYWVGKAPKKLVEIADAVLEIGPKVDSRGGPYHEVTLYNGYSEGTTRIKKINANYIDVCTGVGQQRLMSPEGDRGLNMHWSLWWDYLHPRKSTRATRTGSQKVFSAEMYVRKSVQPLKGARVLVTGGNSPAAIQAVEHALDEDGGDGRENAAAQVVVLASGTVNAGFPGIGRLDYHVTNMDREPLPTRHSFPEVPLRPTNEKVLFCEGFKVIAIEESEDKQQVVVTFASSAKRDSKSDLNSRFVSRGSELEAPEEDKQYFAVFDQVVLSSGRERFNKAPALGTTGDPALGSTGKLIAGCGGFKPLLNGIEDVRAPIALGLESVSGGLVRVLGAAGLNHHLVTTAPRAPQKPLAMYEASLPCQARVAGEGVGLAAATIGYANLFHREPWPERNPPPAKVNRNINFSTLSELQVLFPDGDVAKFIYYSRAWRIAPFTTLQQLANVIACYEYWVADPILDRLGPKPVNWERIPTSRDERIIMFNADAHLLKKYPREIMNQEIYEKSELYLPILSGAQIAFFYHTRGYPA